MLIAAALAVYIAWNGSASFRETDVLAKETAVVGDETYVYRIRNVNGVLQAEWERKVGFFAQPQKGESHLGFAAQVGTSDPKIVVDPTTGRATFEVGKAVVIVRVSR